MDYKINVGDEIPSFIIKDYEGFELHSEDLFGSPYVLYFYPKDGSKGCTTQACSFRDNMETFDGLDTLVIGVSPDSSKSHEDFIESHKLNFTLLCDDNKELARKFDVIRDNDAIERTTFVIDPQGIIQWIERPVNIEGHSQRVINAVKEMQKTTP